MSRHRIVRAMDYSEECDGFDDVYGHSVEDDYCISPSDAAQFMFDRTRQHQMSAFFNEENDIAEEDDCTIRSSKQDVSVGDSEKQKWPDLSEVDEVRLRSCLEEIRSIIGDAVPEQHLIDSVVKNDFDFNKALDDVLSSAASATGKPAADAPKPQRERKSRDRDDEGGGHKSVVPTLQCPCLNVSCNSEMESLGKNVEKLVIRDNVFVDTEVPCSAQQGQNLDIVSETQLNEDSHITCEGVSGSSCPSTAVLGAGPLVEVACSSTRCSGQLHANGCVVRSTYSESISSKPRQIESRSSITLNIPRLKLKVRRDSEKENGADGYNCISSLQALKLEPQVMMHKCDFQNDRASDECNGSVSLGVVAEGHGSRVLEPQALKESSQFSSLAQLANKHSSEAVKLKLSEHSCLSPLTQHANKHVSKVHDLSLQENNFSSLSQLAERHNKMTKLRMSDEVNNFPSLSKRVNRQELEVQAEEHVMTLQELASQRQQVQSEGSVSCLADLAFQHLKGQEVTKASDSTCIKEAERLQNVKPVSCSENECADLEKCLVFSPGNKVLESSGHEVVLSVDQRFDYNLARGSQTESERKWAELSVMSEKMGELVVDCETSLEVGSHVASVKPSPVGRTQSEEDSEVNWEIDLTWALMSPGSKTTESFSNLKPTVADLQLNDVEERVPGDIVLCEAPEVRLDFDASFKILNLKLPLTKRTSSFGRTLCRKWKKLPTPYTVPRKQSLGKIAVFTFDTISPDDKVLSCRRRM